MKLLKYLFTIALFWLSLIASVDAQSNVSLYGSVKGSDHASSDIVPNDWPVSITAVRLDSNLQTKKTSKGGSFHVAAPKNTVIDLVFCSTGYVDYTVGRINTAGLSEYRVPPVPVSLNKIVKESALLGRPRTKLGQARATAQRTGEIDIFLYNLEVYRNVYAGDRAALEEINKFELDLRSDQSFKSQLTPERVRRWEVYKQTLNSSVERPAADPSEIIGLIKDESVFPGIRIDMIRKHLHLIDNSNVKTEVLTYFRKESSDPFSGLFDASLVALAKIGNDTTDRQIILENLKSGDPDRQIASLNALSEGQSVFGISELSDVIKSSADPSVSYSAKVVLYGFALRDKSAAEALQQTNMFAIQYEPTFDKNKIHNVTNLPLAFPAIDPSKVPRGDATKSTGGSQISIPTKPPSKPPR